ncbi:hypothetical protein V2J09_011264 [Rumex salicifolius]
MGFLCFWFRAISTAPASPGSTTSTTTTSSSFFNDLDGYGETLLTRSTSYSEELEFKVNASEKKFYLQMDPTRSGDVLRHLEKQNELLQEAHDKMNQEMHKLQVEQEMLMRKFYQVTTALDQTIKPLRWKDLDIFSIEPKGKGGGTANATTVGDDIQTESTSQ